PRGGGGGGAHPDGQAAGGPLPDRRRGREGTVCRHRFRSYRAPVLYARRYPAHHQILGGGGVCPADAGNTGRTTPAPVAADPPPRRRLPPTPRRRRGALTAGAAGVLLLAGLGLWFGLRTRPPDRGPGVTFLDELDPGRIPEVERYDWQPRDLVAVLGTHRRR